VQHVEWPGGRDLSGAARAPNRWARPRFGFSGLRALSKPAASRHGLRSLGLRFCEPELPVSARCGEDLGSLSKRHGGTVAVACDVTWVSETTDGRLHSTEARELAGPGVTIHCDLWGMQVKKNVALNLAFVYSLSCFPSRERKNLAFVNRNRAKCGGIANLNIA
jgi:hypothetical protein